MHELSSIVFHGMTKPDSQFLARTCQQFESINQLSNEIYSDLLLLACYGLR